LRFNTVAIKAEHFGLLLLLQQSYVVPLQGCLLRSAPRPTSVKQCSLKTREK